MPKARKKKGTSFKSSATKSIFLYGKPNTSKTDILRNMQASFLALINENIEILSQKEGVTLYLIKNDKKSSEMRMLEKTLRKEGINSAFCQNAFDAAVTHLSNRLDSIRLDMHASNQSIFTQSKVLFAMSIDGADKQSMTEAISAISKKADDFYDRCVKELQAMSSIAFDAAMAEFHDAYMYTSLEYRIPVLKSVFVPLDSRLMKIEVSERIEAPFVITITDPFHKNKRFCVPLNTSRHSLHKIEVENMAGTVTFTVRNNDIKVSWAYKHSFVQPKTNTVIGVDAGIIDALSVSDGKTYGSMKNPLDFYKDVVEPAFAEFFKLRNKKNSISHYLRSHPNLPDDERRFLIRKMDNLEHMVQTMDAPYRKKRRYYSILDETISKSVKAYVGSLSKNVLTVIEQLDIKEFNKSRKINGMFSIFARGKLQQRLIEELNWHGYGFIEVDPAYTSQLCPICGCVDKNNRNSKSFKCTCCGYTDDADHNASVNIRDRAADTEILEVCEKYKYSKKQRHKEIKEVYDTRNELYKQNHPSAVA